MSNDLKKKVLRNITRKRLDAIAQIPNPHLMNRDDLIANIIARWPDHRDKVASALESQAQDIRKLD